MKTNFFIFILDTAAMDSMFYSTTNGIPSESKLATYMVSRNIWKKKQFLYFSYKQDLPSHKLTSNRKMMVVGEEVTVSGTSFNSSDQQSWISYNVFRHYYDQFHISFIRIWKLTLQAKTFNFFHSHWVWTSSVQSGGDLFQV